MWLSAATQILAQTPVVVKAGLGGANLISTPTGLYFQSGGLLYKTDGTSESTVTVKNSAGKAVQVVSPFYYSSTSSPAFVNGRLYIEAFNSGASTIVYIDASGVAKPVNAAYSGRIDRLINLNDRLYFLTYNNGPTGELWQTTEDGAQATLIGSYPSGTLTQFNGQFYYLAPKVSSDFAETNNNLTLWRIPLPSSVAVAVTDVPLSSNSGQQLLIAGNGSLYIGGTLSAFPYRGVALYQSDGTAGGTIPLSLPVAVTNNTSYFSTRILDGQLYFDTYITKFYSGGPYRVNKANRSLENARDVYGPLPVGVGTTANFINYKGLFYFSAYNTTLGRELWRSDGTLVKDIQTGVGDSDPQNFFIYNGSLYFTASGYFIGRELYRTDGTEAGTQLVADLVPGPGDSSPDNLTIYNNELYFTAASNLYKLPNNVVTPPTSPTTTTGLTLSPPTYDCNSGQLTYSATGGNGQPIEYRIAGVRDWAASNSFSVPTAFRTGTTLNLDARQSGTVIGIAFNPGVQCAAVANPDLGPLIDLYNSTDGANWINKTNWLTGTSPCNWYGVTCDGNGRVTELRYSQNNLNGTLPASLGNLSELKTLLIFNEPNLAGTLPASLGNLNKLQLLEIEYTKITGEIPASLGNLAQLRSLFLAVNKLTGPLPASLGNLPQLQNLYLFVNQLTGCIPGTFAALCGKDVRLYSNAGLSGSEDFGSFCKTGAGGCSPGSLVLTLPSYDCNSGQLLLNTAGGNNTTVEYRIAGLGDWTTSNAFTVPAYQRTGTSFTLQARQSGQVIAAPFTAVCQASPVTASGLYLATPTFDCTTGNLTLFISGGNGQPIEYRVAGLRDWATGNSFTVPAYQRNGTAFTLQARQSGQVTSLPFTANCPANARISAEPTGVFSVVVYPNPVGEQFSVGVSGAVGQTVRYRLSNLQGQTVLEQRGTAQTDQHTETIKLPTPAAGLYLLQVSTDTRSLTIKVLKP